MASALENFVNSVRTLSSTGNYEELAFLLPNSRELLTKNWNILDNVLETLDLEQHSLAVLYVLLAKFSSISQNLEIEDNVMYTLFKDFIEKCSRYQISLATSAYYELCHLITNKLMSKSNCIQYLPVFALAINKIRTRESQLIPTHADLCQISLKSKCFHVVLKYLDVDITSISTGSELNPSQTDTNTDAKYFLLYYYYGGMIYTAMKNMERALFFYEVCISTPAMAMSYIMLEAYKKYILVSLILHGKVQPIPKYSSQIITRFIKPIAQVYHAIASAYGTGSIDDLRMVINKYTEAIERDKNMGLVKQVVVSLYKANIQRLTRTFITLSLNDVANRAHLPNANVAEKLIFQMIKTREINATINEKDGMVVFKEDAEKYYTPEMFAKIQNDIDNIVKLVREVNRMDEEILLNPAYVKKAIAAQDDDVSSQTRKSITRSKPAD